MKKFEEIQNELLLLLKDKNYEEVEKKSLDILKSFAENSSVFNILGLAQVHQKKFFEAEENLKKGLRLNPKDLALNNSLGNLYSRLGEHQKAINYYKKAALTNHNVSSEIFNNLGNAQRELGLFLDSLKSYKKAINLNKNALQYYLNCSSLLASLGKIPLALIFLKKALIISNYRSDIYSTYLGLLLYNNPISLKKIKFELDSFDNLSIINSNHIITNKNPKIRLGFVSADLRNHPVGFFLFDLLNFFKKDFDIYAYYNHKIEDDLTKKIKPLFHKWSVITEKNDDFAFKLIKEDKIDILFDLSGHTIKNRLSLFAKKPAKIQITWAGWLMSTGLKKMDFIIVDPHVVSEHDKIFFVEKFLFMKDIWCCYSNNLFKIKPKELPALKNKYITFGSFNSLLKLNNEVIKVWSEILMKIPTSKLFLKTEMLNYEFIRDRILNRFARNGVKKDQLILEGQSPRDLMFECYNKIDIALDPFPYNGGTTSFELSKMAVPLLTKKGDSFVSRCGYSLNKNLAMDEWIAKNNNDYIAKAITFSSDINYLSNIKSELAQRVNTSPLFDTNKFYKNFKDCLLNII
jgi:predicted O-linked N-acetylglucosamine transferase (SPINDLY family)